MICDISLKINGSVNGMSIIFYYGRIFIKFVELSAFFKLSVFFSNVRIFNKSTGLLTFDEVK